MRYYVKVKETDEFDNAEVFEIGKVGIENHDDIENPLGLLTLKTIGTGRDQFIREFKYLDGVREDTLPWRLRGEILLITEGFNPIVFNSGLWPRKKLIMEFVE